MEELAGDSVAQTQIGFLRSKVDDEDSSHFIDDVSMALDGGFVDAKTLERLNLYCDHRYSRSERQRSWTTDLGSRPGVRR